MFVKNLGVSEGNIKCIPNNEEKYISFSKEIVVDSYEKDGKKVEVKHEIRFLDSFKFMASSLAGLVENLKKSGLDKFVYLKKEFREKFELLTQKGDVLLLADVFEEFRNICMENYSLDPAWYYTSPGLSWDALLKHSKVNLELLTDPDMLLMFEKGIRGGVSMISNRHGQANNKYMEKKFDPTQPSKFVAYLDANNLYGWAMMKPLPVGDFKWMNKEELEKWMDYPCVLEVDLEFPGELYDLHNDYPLAPERLKINKVEKLIPNLWDKKKYVLHCQNLK